MMDNDGKWIFIPITREIIRFDPSCPSSFRPGEDEFFAQGDKEKELGIPVGMLNDRDKVNRCG